MIFFERELWCDLAGIVYDPPKKLPDLSKLKKTEWSPRFEKLMRNRLIMGGIRYGFLHAKNKPQYNRIDSIRKRLKLYEKEGNLEHLVDIANLCLMEFEEGDHPLKHFKSNDDKNHTQTKDGYATRQSHGHSVCSL